MTYESFSLLLHACYKYSLSSLSKGIYYYRNQSVWKSLKTRCKKEAFKLLINCLSGTPPAVNDTSFRSDNTSKPLQDTKQTPNNTLPSTSELIKAYLAENGNRWCAREYKRINSSLGFLPKGVITRQIAIEVKASLAQE